MALFSQGLYAQQLDWIASFSTYRESVIGDHFCCNLVLVPCTKVLEVFHTNREEQHGRESAHLSSPHQRSLEECTKGSWGLGTMFRNVLCMMMYSQSPHCPFLWKIKSLLNHVVIAVSLKIAPIAISNMTYCMLNSFFLDIHTYVDEFTRFNSI